MNDRKLTKLLKYLPDLRSPYRFADRDGVYRRIAESRLPREVKAQLRRVYEQARERHVHYLVTVKSSVLESPDPLPMV